MDLKRSQRIVKGFQGSRSFSDDLQNLKGSRRISEAQRLRELQSISRDLRGSQGISTDLKKNRILQNDFVHSLSPAPGGCNKVIFSKIT